MVNSQAILFLIFTLDGMIIGILFDFFRILRKSFSTGNILTALEDIIFWILTGIILLYTIFVYNNGIIRGYMFLGAFFGVLLYILTLSKLFIKVNVFIIMYIKKVVNLIFRIIMIPIKILSNLILKPLSFIFINLKKLLKILRRKINLNIFKYGNKAKN